MVWDSPSVTRKFLLLLAGLSCLYLLLVVGFGRSAPKGDEIRYLSYAENLTQGFYTPSDDPHLRNGPGYPLFLAPLVAMNIPLFSIRLINMIFLLGGLCFFYWALIPWLPSRVAFTSTLLLGLYPPLLQWTPYLYSECFVFFLICGSIYFLIRWMYAPRNSWRLLLLVALFFSGLIHTRVVFAMLTLAMIGLCFGGYLLKKHLPYRQAGIAFSLAFILFLPYVGYTYSLTGKWFYLGTNGGASLYWMSSPHAGEWGNWNSEQKVPNMPEFAQEHRDLYDKAFQLSHIERDSLFRALAKENVQSQPEAYLKNWVANIGRFVFHHPYSYRTEGIKTYFYIIPNMFLVVMALLSLIPAWHRRKEFPPVVLVPLAIALIYFGGSSLIHATTRYLVLFVPFFLPYLAFVYGRLVKVEWRKT